MDVIPIHPVVIGFKILDMISFRTGGWMGCNGVKNGMLFLSASLVSPIADAHQKQAMRRRCGAGAFALL
jgi:hypothetical protein